MNTVHTLLTSTLLTSLCVIHATGCRSSPPAPEPIDPATKASSQPTVDPQVKADLEFFCKALSDELMSTPDDAFTQVVFAHWTGTITSPEVLALIDTLTDSDTADPISLLDDALTRVRITSCPVTQQLFDVQSSPDSSTELPREATTQEEMRDALRRVVQANISDIQTCYKNELRVSPDFDGRMKLGITIDAQGAVSEISVEYNEDVAPRDEFTSCLYNEVLMWTFPIPPTAPMKVVYPLKFTS